MYCADYHCVGAGVQINENTEKMKELSMVYTSVMTNRVIVVPKILYGFNLRRFRCCKFSPKNIIFLHSFCGAEVANVQNYNYGRVILLLRLISKDN